MDKTIVVKISGSNDGPREINIRPGSTTKDVLDALGVGRSMMLTADPAGEPFGLEENLWPRLESGQKIFCSPVMEVGKN